MVEALRDYEPWKCGNGTDCFVEIGDLGKYKNTSATRAYNPHFKEYDIDAWKNIIDVFAMRVSCLFEISEMMDYEQYCRKVTPSEIYVMELKKAEMKGVFVLSAFPEFLLDYFGVKLWKTSVRYIRKQNYGYTCYKGNIGQLSETFLPVMTKHQFNTPTFPGAWASPGVCCPGWEEILWSFWV